MQRIDPEPRRAQRADRSAAGSHAADMRPLAAPPGPMMAQLNAADPNQGRDAIEEHITSTLGPIALESSRLFGGSEAHEAARAELGSHKLVRERLQVRANEEARRPHTARERM